MEGRFGVFRTGALFTGGPPLWGYAVQTACDGPSNSAKTRAVDSVTFPMIGPTVMLPAPPLPNEEAAGGYPPGAPNILYQSVQLLSPDVGAIYP
mmetsp:Transcript_58872/g.137542  ORF Transcript_58872/g.137542 Transcript_58872/m.137542 type:complete len:94 (+) Transcript_58872:1556-1837(+)